MCFQSQNSSSYHKVQDEEQNGEKRDGVSGPDSAVLRLLRGLEAVAALAAVTLVTVAAESVGQELQLLLRVPAGDGELAVPGGLDVVAVGAEVQVVWRAQVPPHAPPVALAQEVAAHLRRPRHVGDVLAQPAPQKPLYPGAVVLNQRVAQREQAMIYEYENICQ